MPNSVSPARTTTDAPSGMRCGAGAGVVRAGVARGDAGRELVRAGVVVDVLAGYSRLTTREFAQPASATASRHATAMRTPLTPNAPAPATR
jgi:hypothetical protein